MGHSRSLLGSHLQGVGLSPGPPGRDPTVSPSKQSARFPELTSSWKPQKVPAYHSQSVF